jgi:hypothetical protein
MQQKPVSPEPASENPASQDPTSQKPASSPCDFEKKLSFLERLELSPFYETLSEKKKDIGYFLLCFVLALFLIVTLISRSKQNKAQDAQLADLYARELKKTAKIFEDERDMQLEEQKSQKELFASLLKIAKSSPEVEQLYAGLIAQELMLAQSKEAEAFGEKAITTLQKDGLSVCARFSEISLLSSQNLFKEALEKANALAEEKELENSPILFACTLLQKQTLEKVLGFDDACAKTKEKLTSFLKTEKVRANAKLEQLFKDSDHSIFDFKI